MLTVNPNNGMKYKDDTLSDIEIKFESKKTISKFRYEHFEIHA